MKRITKGSLLGREKTIDESVQLNFQDHKVKRNCQTLTEHELFNNICFLSGAELECTTTLTLPC